MSIAYVKQLLDNFTDFLLVYGCRFFSEYKSDAGEKDAEGVAYLLDNWSFKAIPCYIAEA